MPMLDQWTPSIQCNRLQNTTGSAKWEHAKQAATLEAGEREYQKIKSGLPPQLQGTPHVGPKRFIAPVPHPEPSLSSTQRKTEVNAPHTRAPKVAENAFPQAPQPKPLPMQVPPQSSTPTDYNSLNTYVAWRSAVLPYTIPEPAVPVADEPTPARVVVQTPAALPSSASPVEEPEERASITDTEPPAMGDSFSESTDTIGPQYAYVQSLNTHLGSTPSNTSFGSTSVSVALHSLFSAADKASLGYVTVSTIVDAIGGVPSEIDNLNSQIEALNVFLRVPVTADRSTRICALKDANSILAQKASTVNQSPVRNASVRFLNELVATPNGHSVLSIHADGRSFGVGTYAAEYKSLSDSIRTSSFRPTTDALPKHLLSSPLCPGAHTLNHASYETARDRWMAMNEVLAAGDDGGSITSPYRLTREANTSGLYEPQGPLTGTPTSLSPSKGLDKLTPHKSLRNKSMENEVGRYAPQQSPSALTGRPNARLSSMQMDADGVVLGDHRQYERAKERRDLLLHRVSFLNELLRQVLLAEEDGPLTALVSRAFLADVVQQNELDSAKNCRSEMPTHQLVADEDSLDEEEETVVNRPHAPLRTQQTAGIVPNLARRVPGLFTPKKVDSPPPQQPQLLPPTKIDRVTFTRVMEGIVFGRYQ